MAKEFPLVPNRRTSADPFDAVLQPPPGETPADRDRRLLAELEAKRVSDSIDEMLKAEKKERRSRPDVKILLLGQSESGKSTTLKQFQLIHAPAAFHADRMAWRAVIYLNLVRSIRRILDAISPDCDHSEDGEDNPLWSSVPAHTNTIRVAQHEQYRVALEPLKELEERLIRMLSSPNEDEAVRVTPSNPEWNSCPIPPPKVASKKKGRPSPIITIPHSRKPSRRSPKSPSATPNLPSPSGSSNSSSKSKHAEVSVHHTSNWKKAFGLGNKLKSTKSAHTNEIDGWWDDPADPVHVINACALSMLALWKDHNVRKRLQELKLRLEESSGFFLDEISRITGLRYFPTDQDVLKARLKTLGVVEHTFSIPDSQRRSMVWKIYDVGGARNQRAAWAPYFEDVNAIIFLAPISAFDQVLAEDPRINRLEDSFSLWCSLVSNRLLTSVSIILFLNKVDLLQAKLRSGVQLRDYMPIYKNENDYESVARYFRHRFSALHQQFSADKERELKIHFTSVTDTRRTATIINSVREIIVTTNLKSLQMM